MGLQPWYAASGRLPFAAVVLFIVAVAAQAIRLIVTRFLEYQVRVNRILTGLSSFIRSKLYQRQMLHLEPAMDASPHRNSQIAGH